MQTETLDLIILEVQQLNNGVRPKGTMRAVSYSEHKHAAESCATQRGQGGHTLRTQPDAEWRDSKLKPGTGMHRSSPVTSNGVKISCYFT